MDPIFSKFATSLLEQSPYVAVLFFMAWMFVRAITKISQEMFALQREAHDNFQKLSKNYNDTMKSVTSTFQRQIDVMNEKYIHENEKTRDSLSDINTSLIKLENLKELIKSK